MPLREPVRLTDEETFRILKDTSGADDVHIRREAFGDSTFIFTLREPPARYNVRILTDSYSFSTDPRRQLVNAGMEARSYFKDVCAKIKHSPVIIKSEDGFDEIRYEKEWVDDREWRTRKVANITLTDSKAALDDYQRTLDALAKEAAEAEDMQKFTSSEKYDRIVMAVRDINRGMALRTLEAEPVQMGGSVFDESGRPMTVVDDDEYVFDRVVFADRVNSIVAVLKPARDGHVIQVRPADLEDIFPQLAEMIEGEIEAGGLFESFKELGDEASALVADRVTFGKTLSEATYKTVTEATVLKTQTKKRAEESHYAASSLHGLL